MTFSDHFIINSPPITYQIIDGEVIIINLDNGTYYSLRQTGAEIWLCLENNFNNQAIIEQLSQRYPIDTEQLKNIINLFLAELHREQLIKSVTQPEIEHQIDAGSIMSPVTQISIAGFELPQLDKYTDMQSLLLLDPIHQVTEQGWPQIKTEPVK